MKTPPTRSLTDVTPVVSKILVDNHSDFYAPPTALGVLLIPIRHLFTSSKHKHYSYYVKNLP